MKEKIKLITELGDDISAATISYHIKDLMRNNLKKIKKTIDDEDKARKLLSVGAYYINFIDSLPESYSSVSTTFIERVLPRCNNWTPAPCLSMIDLFLIFSCLLFSVF